MGGVVGAGHDNDLVVGLVGLLVGTIAIDGLQVGVGVAVVVSLGINIHVVVQRLHGGFLFLGELMTGGHSGIIQGVSILGAVDGAGQEVVSPGGAGGLVIDLAAQGSGGAQTHPLQIAAVLVDVFVDGINIEIVQLQGGDLVLADLQSGGHAAGNAHNRALQRKAGHQGYTQGQNYPEGDGVGFQFLGFFGCGLLLLGHGGSFLLLAELLLAGCTHGNQFLSKYVLLAAAPTV